MRVYVYKAGDELTYQFNPMSPSAYTEYVNETGGHYVSSWMIQEGTTIDKVYEVGHLELASRFAENTPDPYPFPSDYDDDAPDPDSIEYEEMVLENAALKIKDRRYYTPGDVQMRLHSSIVRYKSRPVYVSCEPDSLNVKLRDLKTEEVTRGIDSSDPDIDISSPPLGYVPYYSSSCLIYTSRSPLRRQKQGVSHESVFSSYRGLDSNGKLYISQDVGWGVDERYLGRMIDGEYSKDFGECCELLRRGIFGAPLSRDLAISTIPGTHKLHTLLYKRYPVGVYFTESDRGVLQPDGGEYLLPLFNQHMKVEVDDAAIRKNS